ncbi:hypothetical protein B0H14DRAFT_3165453 [Mycena olivaceomarginata]|nr:hypothetical protein B0H14DRAFT_3165453 [Mycena olivaceomarginata]
MSKKSLLWCSGLLAPERVRTLRRHHRHLPNRAPAQKHTPTGLWLPSRPSALRRTCLGIELQAFPVHDFVFRVTYAATPMVLPVLLCPSHLRSKSLCVKD